MVPVRASFVLGASALCFSVETAAALASVEPPGVLASLPFGVEGCAGSEVPKDTVPKLR